MSLSGKVALITGGNKGIGRAVALSFAEDGAQIALAARSQPELEAVAAEVDDRGGEAITIVCDVTDQAQVEAMVERTVRELGHIDILVNNAGIALSHKLVGHPDAMWEQIIAVNLTAVFRICRAVVPGMIDRKQGGRIINMASVASKAGGAYMVAYTASKHGLLGLTRALAVELNPHGITVNAICPGYVDTPMTQAAIENVVKRTGRTPEEALAYFVSTNPQNRLFAPEEVAHVALMLAGDDARGITGQAINVDGGAVMF